MIIVLQILLAWSYGHLVEYATHKHILHNHKKFKKIFKRHFGTHHNISRKNDMYDESYKKLLSGDIKFEFYGLLILLIIHLPVLFILPYFYATLLVSCAMYYTAYRKAHIDVAWGKKWLPWHAAHHMGQNQHMNWGIRLPIVDMLFGTYRLDKQVVKNE